MKAEIKKLMERTISQKVRSNGYVITYRGVGNKVNLMLYRALFGRVLSQKQGTRQYRVYYPGYLHNIPHVIFKHKGSLFISEQYDVEPILKIIQKYAGDVQLERLENFAIPPKEYLTGFQKIYRRKFLEQKEKTIDWSRASEAHAKKYIPVIHKK